MRHQSLPSSFNLERFQALGHRFLHVAFVYSIHAAPARAAFENRAQVGPLLLAARPHDLAPPRVGIAAPTLQSASPRFAVDKPAKAHSLNTAFDNVVAHHIHARDRYAPSAVSTRIFSPSLMKGGTCTTRPVSSLAGLVTEEAVADLRPGSVSTTINTTICGSSMPTGTPSKNE